jgi:hypothetical protein
MKRTIDDLPMVKASTLRAHGYIRPETKTTLIRFDDSGVEYQVGVTSLFRAALCGRCSSARGVMAAPNGFACSMAFRRVARASGRAGSSIVRSPCAPRSAIRSQRRPASPSSIATGHCVSILDLAGRSTGGRTWSSRCGGRGSSRANKASIAPRIKDSDHGAAGKADSRIRRASGR